MDALASLLLKEHNSKEEVVSFVSGRGPAILRLLLERPDLWRASVKTRTTVVLFTALAMKHVHLSELGFFADRIVDLMCREVEQSGFTSDLLALLETYCRALLTHGLDLPEPPVRGQGGDSRAANPQPPRESSGATSGEPVDAPGAAATTTPVYKLLQVVSIKQGEVLGGEPGARSLLDPPREGVEQAGQTSQSGQAGQESPKHPEDAPLPASESDLIEPDRCSHFLKALSALLVLPRQKLEFCALEGFPSLSGIAAQTMNASVASGILSCFHSCVFNVVDASSEKAAPTNPVVVTTSSSSSSESSDESADTDEDGRRPRQGPAKPDAEKTSQGSAETPFKIVYTDYALIHPGLLLESVLEKGFLPPPEEFPMLEPSFVPPDAAARKLAPREKPLSPKLAAAADLLFNVAMILRDTLQPETAELAEAGMARLLVDYMCVCITEFETQVRVFADALMRVLGLAKNGDEILAGLLRDHGFAAKTLYLLGLTGNVENASKLCTLLSLCTGMVLDAESPKAPTQAASKSDSSKDLPQQDGVAATSNSPASAAAPLAENKSASSGAFQLIPMDFIATSSVPGVRCTTFDIRTLLRYIAIFGGQILDGKLDMVQQVQTFDDACLALVWLIESSYEVGNEVASIPQEGGEALKRYAQARDSTPSSRLWNMLSVQKEAHSILLLSTALNTVPGLLLTMPGLLSVIASLMAVPGFYSLCLQAFPEKLTVMANFLTSLCASLAKGDAVNYVLCHSILAGLSTSEESIRAVDPTLLAHAMVPLAALETDEILLRILSQFEEVPGPIKVACGEIMEVMGKLGSS